jgi:uncharacterized protein YvpB
MWRRRIVVLVVLVAAIAAIVAAVLAVSGRARAPVSDPPPTAHVPPRLQVRADSSVALDVPVARYTRNGRLDAQAVERLLVAALPKRDLRADSRVRIAYRYDIAATARRITALGAQGGAVQAVRDPIASRMAAPVVAQRLRNNCEAAALEILMSTVGRDVDQLRIQRAFPTSGPLDPQGNGDLRVWGDPQRGYVGRADGGGVAGGFGVYPPPVRTTAQRLGVRLDDLTGSDPSRVYARLLAGHAVMAWVGLSNGPFGSWRSPQGRAVSVNFGEHTVVLYGMRSDGDLEVSNPLEGTREVWSRARFEAMWQLLGRRALST